MFSFEQLIGKEAADRLRNLGLHKVAAARLRAEGHNVGEEMELKDAVSALGSKIYQKNAEYKTIVEGLNALDKVSK